MGNQEDMRLGAKAFRDWTHKGPAPKKIGANGKLVDENEHDNGQTPSSPASKAAPPMPPKPQQQDTTSYVPKPRVQHGSEVLTLSNGATLEVFPDGRKIQRSPDGTVIEIFNDGTKVQTSPSGTKIEVRPNGSKVQTNPDGSVLEIQPDGFTRQTSPDGTVVETRTDGSRYQRNPNGVTITVYKDGSRKQAFPDGTLIEVKPNGEKLQTNPDGTRLEINVDGVIRPRSASPNHPVAKATPTKTAPYPIKSGPSAPMPSRPSLPTATATPVGSSSSNMHSKQTSTSAKNIAAAFESKSRSSKSTSSSSTTSSSSSSLTKNSNSKIQQETKEPSRAGALPRLMTRRNSADVPSANELELQKENVRLKDTLKMIEAKAAEDMASLRAQTQKDVQKLMQEVEESRSKVQQASKLETALLETTSDLERTKKDLDSVINANSEELAELKLKLMKAEADTANIQASFDRRLREETESLQAQIRDLEEANKRSVEQLQSTGQDSSAELASISSKLAAAEGRNRELEASVEQLKEALQRQEASAKEAKEEVESHRQTVAKFRETLQAADSEQQALHAQIEDLIFKGGSCAEQLTDLRKERDSAVAERESAFVKLAELTKKTVETVSLLTERENELADAFTEIRQLRENADSKSVDKALAIERDRVQELETKLRAARASTASSKSSPETTEQLEAARRKHQEQERVIASLEQRVETFDVALNKAKEMNANSMEHLRHRLQHAELQCNELQAELDEANDERDKLQAKNAAMASEAAAATRPTSPEPTSDADNNAEISKLRTSIEDLQVQLAKRDREISAQKTQIEKLEKFQAGTSFEALEPIAPPAPAISPPRPPMNALLGQIQAGKELKSVEIEPEVSMKPAGMPGGGVPGGLLAQIQLGAKLKKTDGPSTPSTNPGASTTTKTSPSSPNAAPSFAELCQLKAKQRADKSQRIDDLLAKKKPAASGAGANSELQAALARRKQQS